MLTVIRVGEIENDIKNVPRQHHQDEKQHDQVYFQDVSRQHWLLSLRGPGLGVGLLLPPGVGLHLHVLGEPLHGALLDPVEHVGVLALALDVVPHVAVVVQSWILVWILFYLQVLNDHICHGNEGYGGVMDIMGQIFFLQPVLLMLLLLSNFEIPQVLVVWTDFVCSVIDADEVAGDQDDDQDGQHHRDGQVEDVVLLEILTSDGVSVLTPGRLRVILGDDVGSQEGHGLGHHDGVGGPPHGHLGLVLDIPVEGEKSVHLLQDDIVVEGEDSKVLEKVDQVARPQLTVRGHIAVPILKGLHSGLRHHVHQDVEDEHVDGLEVVLGLPVDPVDDAREVDSQQGLDVGAHQVVGAATFSHRF